MRPNEARPFYGAHKEMAFASKRAKAERAQPKAEQAIIQLLTNRSMVPLQPKTDPGRAVERLK